MFTLSPANITVECDDSTAPGDTNGPATASDNCATATIAFSDSVANGTGNNSVITRTWTATDDNSNQSSYIQTITVVDSEDPVLTNLPGDQLGNPMDAGVCGTIINFNDPAVTDNCDTGVTVIRTDGTGLNSGSLFPAGSTTISYSATDANNNVAIHSFTVTVLADNENPTITCPANVVVSANGSCEATGVDLGTPTTDDNCNVASITNDGLTTYPLGHTIVTWIVTDSAGNSATCQQTVTVNDTTAPTITCPGNQTISLSPTLDSCDFTLPDYTGLATTSDNCPTNVIITQNPAEGDTFSTTTTVTLTATDAAGNSSSCTFDVIPVDDLDPTAVGENITVYLGPNGTVNLTTIEIESGSTDNCAIVNSQLSIENFDCGDILISPIEVDYTVFDAAGNSDMTTVEVTVLDEVDPTAICKTNFVVVIDPLTRDFTIQPSDIDNGSNDACGIDVLKVFPSSTYTTPNTGGANYTFNEHPMGEVYTEWMTLEVTDIHGNVSTCETFVTVEPPKNLDTYLTGVIVPDPNPSDPTAPSPLVEATACPGGSTEPRNVDFNLQPIDPYDFTNVVVNFWEYSDDNGETWTTIPGTAGTFTHTMIGLTSDTFVRLNITDSKDPLAIVTNTSAEAYVRFLPPEEPPILISQSAIDICLTDSVTILAESFFDQPNGQFGDGGEFNYAQPDGWRVDYQDGYFPASGNTTTQPTWKETNSNNNQLFSGINYDTGDNTKFAMANGINNITQLETPVFSTIGMTASEAILTFDTSYYFCEGGYGTIWLSFDSGNTYTVPLSTNEGFDFTPATNSNVEVVKSGGNCSNGQRPTTNPRMETATINLGPYIGESGLRIRFEFFGSTSACQDTTFPKAQGNNCSNDPTYDVASGWAIDAVGFAFAVVDDVLEWTDEDNTVIAVGTEATVTPVTPGIRKYGVTALVNGCRADNDAGTNFVDIYTSLAYAGEDYVPLGNECGESVVQLKAYDNTKTAVENYARGAWVDGLYVVPDVSAGDTDFAGTGVTGVWSIDSVNNTSCGSTAAFSSNTDPDAIFTGDPGDYVLTWTLSDSNSCPASVNVKITNCSTIDFDGVNDNITFRNNYNLNSAFSIESWVKPNSVNGTRTVLSKKDASDDTKGYALTVVNGQVRFNWYSNSGSGLVTSGGDSIGTERWYHLAVTFNGTNTYKLYVDGIELASVNNGVAPSATPASIETLLGAMDQAPPNNTPMNYFHGWMDELRIWDMPLSAEHIRQMMNQRIEASGNDVVGTVIPTKIYGTDMNLDGVEDNVLSWSNLKGYYRMDVTCGDLSPYEGVSGRLRNITTSQDLTAPLPYTSRANQAWGVDNTWTNFNVWDYPNSTGINGDPIEWNIVRTAHNITSGDKDITLLGLIVDSNELSIEDPGTTLDHTNAGQMLWITHYLKLTGTLDLVGESQLIQKRYGFSDDDGDGDGNIFTTSKVSYQFNESIFDNTSTGSAERDQQGVVSPFNYNYLSSPFAPTNAGSNNANTYSIGGVLRDGTITVADQSNRNINWITDVTAATGGANLAQVSTRWLYSYSNNAANTYSEWEYLNTGGTLNVGLGYTMKGSGSTATTEQNYVFVGKPNNETISNTVSPYFTTLLGNPYPSAIDAYEFIKDNIPFSNPDGSSTPANSSSDESIDGTLYFWEHYDSNTTHILRDYEGGYAIINFTGELPASTPPMTYDGIQIIGGASTKVPERYVPIGQGFFVNGSPQGGLIKFNNDQRVYERENSGSSVFFAANPGTQERSLETIINENLIKRIRITFKSPEGAIRPLLIGFVPNNKASDGFNYGFDAYHFDNFPSDMYWLIDNSRFVMQGVGDFDVTKKYPLGLRLGMAGDIEISLQELENFERDTPIYIYDQLTDAYTQINDDDFVLPLDANEYPDRFYLAFETGEEESIIVEEEPYSIDSVRIYYLSDTKEIYINWVDTADIKEVILINILGQTVREWDNIDPLNEHEIRIPVKNISEGNYVIKVINNHGKTTNKKVVIKQ